MIISAFAINSNLGIMVSITVIGFSFCNAPFFNNVSLGVANTENPAYQPPIEYGKDGQPAAVPIIQTMNASGIQNNLTTRPAPGSTESQQLLFPFASFNAFDQNFDNSYEYPLMLVNYVEVLGQAGNIQI